MADTLLGQMSLTDRVIFGLVLGFGALEDAGR